MSEKKITMKGFITMVDFMISIRAHVLHLAKRENTEGNYTKVVTFVYCILRTTFPHIHTQYVKKQAVRIVNTQWEKAWCEK